MIAKFFKRKSCVAIELGYSAIKGIKFCGSGSSIDACGIFPFSSRSDYPYDNPEIVVPALVSLRDKLNAKGKKVKICVNMSHVTVREIKVPVVPEDELYEVVKWELKKIIDFNEEEYNLDFKVLEKIESEAVPKFLVKVYVGRKAVLKQYVSLIEHADMEVDLITIPPYALRALFTALKGEAKSSVAIVDLGAKSSTLSILKNGMVRFERQLMFSSFELCDMLDKKRIEYSSLENLYLGFSLGDGSLLDKITSEALTMLIEELTKSFGYYNSVIKGGSVDGLYLTGGLANIPGIDSLLSTSLGINTELLNPFTRFSCKDVSIDPLRIGVCLGVGLLK